MNNNVNDKIMNKFVKYVQFGCLGLALWLTSSCIRDGLDECPPESEYYSYIKFVYDYNMSFEDLFHKQVSKIDLYLFDENGVYMHKLSDRVPEGSTFKKGYVMGLPEEYKDVVQFVAFPGIDEGEENVTNMVAGQSRISDLSVQLNERQWNTVDTEFKPLWHGNVVDSRRTRVGRNDTTVISLTKNTNKIRIVLQSLSDSIDVDVNNFQFNLEALNSSYDAYNVTKDDTPWYYEPYFTYNDENAGAVAELNTMRLLADKTNRLRISQRDPGKTLVDINLTRYINALKLKEYISMPLQEFMDREDVYNIIIFLVPVEGGGDPDPEPEGQWMVSEISINSWIVRDNTGGVDID